MTITYYDETPEELEVIRWRNVLKNFETYNYEAIKIDMQRDEEEEFQKVRATLEAEFSKGHYSKNNMHLTVVDNVIFIYKGLV